MKNSFFIFTLITSTTIHASDQKMTLQCPEKIKVYTKVQEIPKGWHSWDVAAEGKNALKHLVSIGVYDGHPGGKVHLAPDNADSKDAFLIWNFASFGKDRKTPIWISCQYEDTAMLIARNLPTRISKCRMEFVTNTISKKLGPVVCE